MGLKDELAAPWEAQGYPCEMGQYVLLRSLARGGMGEVHLAKHGGLAGIQKYCVVKTLRRHATEDAEYVRRFVDEAAVVVSLQHKNICPVFDVGKVKGRYYLAMEFIAGRDVRALAQAAHAANVVIAPAVAMYIVGEVLEALDYAHRARNPNTGEPLNLVHRDISPQNIMISFEGEAKLIDFGLAASTLKKEQTNPNIIMGKLAYMPPEQLDGKGVDGRADLFAAAVVLYELLAKERFYAGMSDAEILAAASSRTFEPRRLREMDADLQTILRDALQPNRTQRLPDCGEFKDRLTRYMVARKMHAGSRDLRRLIEQLFPDDAQKTRGVLAQFAAVRAPTISHDEKSERIAAAQRPEPPDPPALHGIRELESMSDDMLRAASEASIEVDTNLFGEVSLSPAPGSKPLDPASLGGGTSPVAVGAPRDGQEPTEPTRDIALPTPRAPAVAIAPAMSAGSSPTPAAPGDPFASVPTTANPVGSAATVVVARPRTGDVPAADAGKKRPVWMAAAAVVAVAAVALFLVKGGSAVPAPEEAVPPPTAPAADAPALPAADEPAAPAAETTPPPGEPSLSDDAQASASDDVQAAAEPTAKEAADATADVDEPVAEAESDDEADAPADAVEDDDDAAAGKSARAKKANRKKRRRATRTTGGDDDKGAVAWKAADASAPAATSGPPPKLRAGAKPEAKIRFLEIYCVKRQSCASKLVADFRGMRVTDAKVFWSKVDACVLICSPGSLQ